jgi:spore coat polysaccharide biosynthesis predicted glycosyltransferase SpsG/CMP-N-acetylneuraminic acid synthetase
MIPARAGSKTIPKKNLRLLAGKPLFSYVLETLSTIAEKNQIIVSTDDEEIVELAAPSALIHHRSASASDDAATLDDTAMEVARYLQKNHGANSEDVFVTVQPTSPFITPETIQKAVKKQRQKNVDTVITVKDDRHLRWTKTGNKSIPLYEERVNRQQMQPVFAETGGVISTSIGYLLQHGSRIGKNISLIEVDEREGLDIDNYSDWALAEYWKKKLRICIRVDGSRKLGFGHLYRSLAIAQNINDHDIYFVTRSDNGFDLGKVFLENHFYSVLHVKSNEDFLKKIHSLMPDIVINDILDTDAGYISSLKKLGCFVVNFEDLGDGNRIADLVINDLYPNIFPLENHWYGVEYSILNPNFELIQPKSDPSGPVNHILLAYGGTDPSDLTMKALRAIKKLAYPGKVTVVIGPGHSKKPDVEKLAGEMKNEVTVLQNVKNMALLMKKADLALTSAGRTVTELMCVGVPTIAMCQNMREIRHNHASSNFGVVNLGLGKSISVNVLAEHILMFLEDVELRKDMYSRMRKTVEKRSNHEVVKKIISEYKKHVSHK